MLALILLGDFLRHIPCWLHFDQGSFSYTSRAGFIFMQGISVTHPMLHSFLCREFVWHIPFCLHFYAGSFSYTYQAAFIFIWGISLTHPMLASFLSGEFLLHIPSWLYFIFSGSFSYTSNAGFFSFLCEKLLSSAVYSEDNPLRKVLGGSWPRRKVWKSHTQALDLKRAEQNQRRTEWKVGTGMKGEEKKWIWALNKP